MSITAAAGKCMVSADIDDTKGCSLAAATVQYCGEYSDILDLQLKHKDQFRLEQQSSRLCRTRVDRISVKPSNAEHWS